MTPSEKNILAHWSAYIYEQQEDETDLIACVKRMLGDAPLRILEPACGGGKLSAPLAEAGHDVTGFDIDEAMLAHAYARAEALPNLHIRKANMLTTDWGRGYDAVLLCANLMVNIQTDWSDYKQAQKKLLVNAHKALRPGGHLLLDFACPDSLKAYVSDVPEWVCFEGADDRGTHGRYIVINGTVNEQTRTVKGKRRYELIPRDSNPFTVVTDSLKHFPTLEQTCSMLYRAGFTIEELYGDLHGHAFDRQHQRSLIRCRKVE
ncbi:MAG: class I SAM-dependent methyltransferase [Christensenellaceae bacterium]|nr:class I SAM-dependent methyltransferase [Christensenellaceae bacterium]